ncbi:MAG TPA: hypothetical protein VN828_21770, partial [Acidobacteriaceae bacterium]|nr:hypothetical protein [Acidobacteriaceae bacterium]
MRLLVPVLLFAASASGQWIAPTAGELLLPAQSVMLLSAATPDNGAQQLLTFRDSDIKFGLQSMMDILRDHQHEGWVLAAYPDPTTHRPLIGAGFSLDVLETPHPQY